MFFSRDLLQKNGALASVWTSSHTERKLTKTNILQSNLAESVREILKPSQAPLALRVTGQLLLGVVRIYNRKTRYLLDDCTEALLKIKMAFRATITNDNPAALAPDRESLMIPDRITPNSNFDLLVPDCDLSQIEDVASAPVGRRGRAGNRDINLQEEFSSQFLPADGMAKDDDAALAPLPDLDLDLDFGLDLDENPEGARNIDMSMEVGRDAPQISIEDDMISEMDAGRGRKDRSEQESTLPLDFGDSRLRIADDDGDIAMADDLHFNVDDSTARAEVAIDMLARARISESPLSDIDEDFAKEVEEQYNRKATGPGRQEEDDDGEEAVVRKPRTTRKQNFIIDDVTVLTREQLAATEPDTGPLSGLPDFVSHDPRLAGLSDLWRSGDIVSHFYASGFPPELDDHLAVPGTQRKRGHGGDDDEGEQGADDERGAHKSPRLDLGDEDGILGESVIGNQSMPATAADGTMLEIPADDDDDDDDEDDEDDDNDGAVDAEVTVLPFDETTAPVVHPADSGPVSIATTHAVHILRDVIGAEAAENDEKRKNMHVVFQDLIPEGKATKADATKMFFECLVLATKDAIQVEQGKELGAPIRIRAKRGLWGAWAEREAGGEMAAEEGNGENTNGNGNDNGVGTGIGIGHAGTNTDANAGAAQDTIAIAGPSTVALPTIHVGA